MHFCIRLVLQSFTATGCAVQSPTQIFCNSGQGAGKDHIWTVTIGAETQQSPNNALGRSSYAAPAVSSFVHGSLRTDGGDAVFLLGQNFVAALSLSVR